jgi:hypothetical protein
MDEFHVKHLPGSGTEVTLVKRIDPAHQLKQGGTDREHESHNSTS